MVPGGGGVGNPHIAGNPGVPARAAAKRQRSRYAAVPRCGGEEVFTCAAVRGWRMESRIAESAGARWRFLSGDYRDCFARFGGGEVRACRAGEGYGPEAHGFV